MFFYMSFKKGHEERFVDIHYRTIMALELRIVGPPNILYDASHH